MVILLIQKLLNHYNLKTAQDLYYLIATEKLELLEIKEVLLKEESHRRDCSCHTVLPEKETKGAV